jgi:hypothetical protein
MSTKQTQFSFLQDSNLELVNEDINHNKTDSEDLTCFDISSTITKVDGNHIVNEKICIDENLSNNQNHSFIDHESTRKRSLQSCETTSEIFIPKVRRSQSGGHIFPCSLNLECSQKHLSKETSILPYIEGTQDAIKRITPQTVSSFHHSYDYEKSSSLNSSPLYFKEIISICMMIFILLIVDSNMNSLEDIPLELLTSLPKIN